MISVICPVLNEIRFLPAWFACVSKFAHDIVVVDTGSTDGSIEFLRASGVKVHLWPEKLDYGAWNTGTEGRVRNFMISQCKGDWIVPLDADELVDGAFGGMVRKLNQRHDEFAIIYRFTHYFFWGSKSRLRTRSLKPLLFSYGKFRPLRNWRGNYPNKIPRLFKNIPQIRYSTKPSHCLLEYRGLGRLSYHLPWVTTDVDLGFYHYHYAIKDGKTGGNMDWELGKLGRAVNTTHYSGGHPEEISLIEGLLD